MVDQYPGRSGPIVSPWNKPADHVISWSEVCYDMDKFFTSDDGPRGSPTRVPEPPDQNVSQRKTNRRCFDCKRSGHRSGEPKCPKMTDSTALARKPKGSYHQPIKVNWVGTVTKVDEPEKLGHQT